VAIKTLLITGENNHDWTRSTPFCRDLLQGTGAFNVDLTQDASGTLADRVALSKYQLLFLDYNGPAWSKEAKRNFIDAVRNGAGVCILHAANNGFEGWTECEELCVLMWREGSNHGAYHKFDVTFTDQEHPITKGLPAVMKDHPDELYASLAHMHDSPYHVLATAYSSPESGGTGKEEPMLIVKTYGEGRVFHCILGHVWEDGPMDTFDSPDFQRVLLRGCEWAATGSVEHC
jgi:uncharacterized protein